MGSYTASITLLLIPTNTVPLRNNEQLTNCRITGTIFEHRYLSLAAHHRSFKRTTVSTRTQITYARVTVYASHWFGCQWSQTIQVFEKFRHVLLQVEVSVWGY